MKATAYTDGACNNAGDKRAGYGVVLTLASGEVVELHGTLGDDSTSNIAEYAAVIAALSQAQIEGVTELDVFADSKLIVEQMSGRWSVSHPHMRVAHTKAREMAARFGSVTFTWIPREKNGRADLLSKRGLASESLRVVERRTRDLATQLDLLAEVG